MLIFYHLFPDTHISIAVLKSVEGKAEIKTFIYDEPVSRRVQQKFEQIVIQIFGITAFNMFVKNNLSEYYEFIHNLYLKLILSTRYDKPVAVKLPAGLLADSKHLKRKKVQKAVQSTIYADKIHFVCDKCKINPEIFMNLFLDVESVITKLINTILGESMPSEKGNNHLVFFGSLSKSKRLERVLQNAFPAYRIDVLVPKQAALVGATIFGDKKVLSLMVMYIFYIRIKDY